MFSKKEVENLLSVILPNTPFANKTFAVGGYVRDEYMGLPAKDLDIVIEFENGSKQFTSYLYSQFPIQISSPKQIGKGFPIWQITFKNDIEYQGTLFHTQDAIIEFSDTTKEMPIGNNKKRQISFGILQEDIERRDFTVNMLVKDLTTGEVKDITGISKQDIDNGILRGNPKVSLDDIFTNDPLRMIRLVRFQSKYGWSIPKSVVRTVRRNAEKIKNIPVERIMEELEKVMKIGKLYKAIKLMKTTKLLQYVFPEVYKLIGVKHDNRHMEGDVFIHTLLVLKNAKPTIEGQLAALLHDIAKPHTQQKVGEKIHFLGHEKLGAVMAESILAKLRFDTDVTSKVTLIIENHMRTHMLVRPNNKLGAKVSDKAIRKFIREVGDDMVDAVLDMAEADVLGKLPVNNYIPGLRERVEAVRNSPIPMKKKPILDGKEIMTILDIEPSPLIGDITDFLNDIEDEYASQGRELTKVAASHLIFEKFKVAL